MLIEPGVTTLLDDERFRFWSAIAPARQGNERSFAPAIEHRKRAKNKVQI
ncbi:hypothetical protein [Curtobacterium sp. ZW137]|nr:hypothetical protein [Curtobacterium sp. ZW137]